MKNILVPVGTSENAVSHLQYAVDFARAFKAKLFVVQVYNVYTKAGTMIKVDQILERESLAFLKKHIAKIDTSEVAVVAKSIKGKLVDTIELICKTSNIDLVLLEPKTNSVKEEVFLGKTSGKIVKQTKMPILIVPEGLKFKPMPTILFAIKSAILKREKSLQPLKDVQAQFNSVVHLLLVKTQYHKEGDFEVSKPLENFVSSITYSENPTTYHGVLEHFKEINPDLLVVVRRKRGFFTKLWEQNSILKKDLYITTIPILVLREMK